MVGWLVVCGARILDFGFWLSLERWCLLESRRLWPGRRGEGAEIECGAVQWGG